MEWLALIDKALGTNFDAPVYNPQKGRDKLTKVIDGAAKQHADGSTKAPNRAWKAGGNNAIRFAPKLDGKPVLLDGQEQVYVPAEHFQTFLAQLKKSVAAGELDKPIKAALDGEKATNSTSGTRKAVKKSDFSDDANHPTVARADYASMTGPQKASVSRLYRNGKNADGSLISEVGHKHDAPLSHKG